MAWASVKISDSEAIARVDSLTYSSISSILAVRSLIAMHIARRVQLLGQGGFETAKRVLSGTTQ